MTIAMIAAAFWLASPMVHAAGLGQLSVISPLGQPLNAEIEIVSLQPGEEEGLVARLASPDAFRAAGIDFNPALVSARFAIERRGGRPLLRVRTTQPVNDPFLEILVDRKSTRLNSSHGYISYAVFCLKKKKKKATYTTQ